jgi:hypothetical protein
MKLVAVPVDLEVIRLVIHIAVQLETVGYARAGGSEDAAPSRETAGGTVRPIGERNSGCPSVYDRHGRAARLSIGGDYVHRGIDADAVDDHARRRLLDDGELADAKIIEGDAVPHRHIGRALLADYREMERPRNRPHGIRGLANPKIMSVDGAGSRGEKNQGGLHDRPEESF